MATKLYFSNAAASVTVAGTLPSVEQSSTAADVSVSGSGTPKKLDSAPIGSPAVRNLTSIASVAQKKELFGLWLSAPLILNQTIGAGPIKLSIACTESDANANFIINSLNIYIWRPSTGVKVGTIIDMPGSALTTGAPAPEASVGGSYTIAYPEINSGLSPVAALAGDVLVVELWSFVTQDSATAYTHQIRFAGTTEYTTDGQAAGVNPNIAAFIEFAENLGTSTESGDGSVTIQSSVAGAGASIAAAAGTIAITSNVAGASRNFSSAVGAIVLTSAVAGVGSRVVPASGAINISADVAGIGVLGIIAARGIITIESDLEAEGMQYFPHIFMQERPVSDTWTKEMPLS